MNNILITLPAKETRRIARGFLQGYWQIAVVALLIYYAITEIPVLIYENAFNKQSLDVGQFIDIAQNTQVQLSPVSGIYQFVMTAVFTLGMALFFLALVRNNGPQSMDVFGGFDYFFKSVGLMFMVCLFTLLWALLLIIPGIIAGLRYSQAFYILADNPEKSIMQCINESKAMMTGNKMKYFCLNLSFIGWVLLASIPAAIFVGVINSTGVQPSVAIQVVEAVLDAVSLIPVAYMSTSGACFYEMLKGKTFTEGVYEADYEVVED